MRILLPSISNKLSSSSNAFFLCGSSFMYVYCVACERREEEEEEEEAEAASRYRRAYTASPAFKPDRHGDAAARISYRKAA